MNVVSFKEFTPTPRYDAVAWHHVTIQEGPTEVGPWTLIDTILLAPVDADPSSPQARNFTTDNATLDEGWYLITFFDASGNDALPVEPIHHTPDVTYPYLPTVEDVAERIMARTKDRLGNELGTFNANTRPTFNQARSIIDQAADDITMLTDTDIPPSAYEYARQAISLKAAMNIERSYFAEQINSNRSPYNALKEEYDTLVGTREDPGIFYRAIERESEEAVSGDQPMTNSPRYSFPEADLRYGLGRPL